MLCKLDYKPYICFLAIQAGLLLGSENLYATANPRFKIVLNEPGVYQVQYQDLLLAQPLATTQLILRNQGQQVPFRVEDGGDGWFGPGDWLEFVAEPLHGESSYWHDYTPLNVYWLTVAEAATARLPQVSPVAGPLAGTGSPDYLSKLHLEQDLLRAPLHSSSGASAPWFWAKLRHIDANPVNIPIEMASFHANSAHPVRLRLQFQGLSEPQSITALPAHQVTVAWNETVIATAEWDGQEPYLLAIPQLDKALIQAGKNTLSIRVPQRTPPEAADPLIDISYLDWIEIDFPRLPLISNDQLQLHPASATQADTPIQLLTESNRQLAVYASDGSKFTATTITSVPDQQLIHRFSGAMAKAPFWVVRDNKLRQPIRIEAATPSSLTLRRNQVDYFIIAHPRLLAAVQPLAAFHRRRGLQVELIDVRDIYDEFNHGILHPQAIRDFLAHAYRHRPPPAPQFVLLVGDASWYTKNIEQPFNIIGDLDHRNLIPTGQYFTLAGPSASDNFFVTFNGQTAQMAIGRLPVTEPEEVTAIVAKTIRYMQQPKAGPWRQRVLLISNQQKLHRQRNKRIADQLLGSGLAAEQFLPAPANTNEQHQQALRAAFDRGQLLVHFYGHGGRYMWQTSPPGLQANSDFFDMDDLDQLQPNGQLPIVLSMTCSSAPFDHPSADSLGEKFLRLSDRGAVAVLAASARNYTPIRFGESLIDQIISTPYLGQAIRNAKVATGSLQAASLYNLLGDPALSPALPGFALDIAVNHEEGRITVSLPLESFNGSALLDWLDGSGRVLLSERTELQSPHWQRAIPGTEQPAAQVRVYVWNPLQGTDGLGTATLSPW